jgi:RHS repeat-associated protein
MEIHKINNVIYLSSILIKNERLRLTKNAIFELKMQKTAHFQYSSNPYSQSVIATLCQPPYWMLIKDRSYTSDTYRFGYNGKENDDETFSGCIAFEARIFDCRIGNFFSTDPWEYKYVSQSPYIFAHNNPIYFIDWLGMGDPPSHEKQNGASGTDLYLPKGASVVKFTDTDGDGQISLPVGVDGADVITDAKPGEVSKFTIKGNII